MNILVKSRILLLIAFFSAIGVNANEEIMFSPSSIFHQQINDFFGRLRIYARWGTCTPEQRAALTTKTMLQDGAIVVALGVALTGTSIIAAIICGPKICRKIKELRGQNQDKEPQNDKGAQSSSKQGFAKDSANEKKQAEETKKWKKVEENLIEALAKKISSVMDESTGEVVELGNEKLFVHKATENAISIKMPDILDSKVAPYKKNVELEQLLRTLQQQKQKKITTIKIYALYQKHSVYWTGTAWQMVEKDKPLQSYVSIDTLLGEKSGS